MTTPFFSATADAAAALAASSHNGVRSPGNEHRMASVERKGTQTNISNNRDYLLRKKTMLNRNLRHNQPATAHNQPHGGGERKQRRDGRTATYLPDEILGAQRSHQEAVDQLRRQNSQSGAATARLLEVGPEAGAGCRCPPGLSALLPRCPACPGGSRRPATPGRSRSWHGGVVAVAVGLLLHCGRGGVGGGSPGSSRIATAASGQEDEGQDGIQHEERAGNLFVCGVRSIHGAETDGRKHGGAGTRTAREDMGRRRRHAVEQKNSVTTCLAPADTSETHVAAGFERQKSASFGNARAGENNAAFSG